jgi:hypothetical protein
VVGRYPGQVGIGQSLGDENQGHAQARENVPGVKEEGAPERCGRRSGYLFRHSQSVFEWLAGNPRPLKDNVKKACFGEFSSERLMEISQTSYLWRKIFPCVISLIA